MKKSKLSKHIKSSLKSLYTAKDSLFKALSCIEENQDILEDLLRATHHTVEAVNELSNSWVEDHLDD